MSHLHDALSSPAHHPLRPHLLLLLPDEFVAGASQLPHLPHACGHVLLTPYSTPGKTRKDEQVAALVEHYRRSRKRGDAKKENSYV